MAIRIGIVSDEPNYIARIRALAEMIEAQVVDAGSNADIAQTTVMGVMSQRPDTVLLGPGIDFDQRVALTEQLDALHPHVVVLWVIDEDPSAARAAMQAGARDIMSPDASDESVIEQLRRAIGIGDRRRSQSGVPDEADPSAGKGRVVSVVSPKGGSGKTMLSTNLAVGLQSTAPRGVVLVDLDLQFGDVSSALGLRAEYSVIDVIKSGGDITAMKAFLTGHPTGLYALPAPTNPAEAEEAEPDQIGKLIDALSGEFSYVVNDTGAGISESTLTAIEQSSDVIFVTTIDVAAIQALRKAVVILDRLRLDEHNRFFVLNRSSSRTGLSKAEIEEVTGLAIDAEIPSHRSVSKAMNEGNPIILEQSRGRVGRALHNVTGLLMPKPTR